MESPGGDRISTMEDACRYRIFEGPGGHVIGSGVERVVIGAHFSFLSSWEYRVVAVSEFFQKGRDDAVPVVGKPNAFVELAVSQQETGRSKPACGLALLSHPSEWVSCRRGNPPNMVVWSASAGASHRWIRLEEAEYAEPLAAAVSSDRPEESGQA